MCSASFFGILDVDADKDVDIDADIEKSLGLKMREWKFKSKDFVLFIPVAQAFLLLFLRYYGVPHSGSVLVYGIYYLLRDPLLKVCIIVSLAFMFFEMDTVKKYWKIFSLSLILLLVIVAVLPVNGAFRATVVNGKRPLSIQYQKDILLDLINGETEIMEVGPEDLQLISHTILLPRVKPRFREGKVDYLTLRYGTGEHENSFLIFSYNYDIYLDQRFSVDSSKMEIEYYPNSGIIKSFDKIAMNDFKSFDDCFEEWKQIKKERRESEKYNKTHKKELDSLALENYYNTLNEATGKQWADVEKEIELAGEHLKERGLEKYYKENKINKISTSYFDAGVVAYCGNEDDGFHFYIAENGEEEMMVVIPEYSIGDNAEDFAQKLRDAGIGFKVYTDTGKELSDQAVKEVSEESGKLIPLEHQITFSTN